MLTTYSIFVNIKTMKEGIHMENNIISDQNIKSILIEKQHYLDQINTQIEDLKIKLTKLENLKKRKTQKNEIEIKELMFQIDAKKLAIKVTTIKRDEIQRELLNIIKSYVHNENETESTITSNYKNAVSKNTINIPVRKKTKSYTRIRKR